MNTRDFPNLLDVQVEILAPFEDMLSPGATERVPFNYKL